MVSTRSCFVFSASPNVSDVICLASTCALSAVKAREDLCLVCALILPTLSSSWPNTMSQSRYSNLLVHQVVIWIELWAQPCEAREEINEIHFIICSATPSLMSVGYNLIHGNRRACVATHEYACVMWEPYLCGSLYPCSCRI